MFPFLPDPNFSLYIVISNTLNGHQIHCIGPQISKTNINYLAKQLKKKKKKKRKTKISPRKKTKGKEKKGPKFAWLRIPKPKPNPNSIPPSFINPPPSL